MSRRGGLGRGLGALIPSGLPDDDAAPGTPGAGVAASGGPVLRELPPQRIRPNPRQPRDVFDADALEELVVSLREVGMLQPVVVRPLAPDDVDGEVDHELVMGERRWRAAQLAGLARIPAIVRRTADSDLLRDALLENLHRAELNALEEGAAYAQLLEDFGLTHAELAARIGRSRAQVTNMMRLLQLPPGIQRRVASGVLSAGHARALLGLPDAAAQEALAGRIVAEGLSVRSVEELVAVGDSPAAPRAPRSARAPDDRGQELAQRVADALDTRATVEMGRAKGRLVIEVADHEDLARVVDLITGDAQQ